MSELIKKYKDWKANPADYGYDCIGEFITDLTESETVEFMEWVEKLSDERSNCNLPVVNNRRELLIAYHKHNTIIRNEELDKFIENHVDEYLSNL